LTQILVMPTIHLVQCSKLLGSHSKNSRLIYTEYEVTI
jgi:hypothetical protein